MKCDRAWNPIVISLALLWLIKGTSVAQYYDIYEWDTFDDPIAYQGGEYEMHLMTDLPLKANCIPYWEVNAYDWLRVNYTHHIKEPDLNPGGWSWLYVEASRNYDDLRNNEFEIIYWNWDYDAQEWYFELWDYIPVSQASGAPTEFSCDPNPVQISPSGPEVEVQFRVNVGDLKVELKYRYEGGAELTAGPYLADEGGYWYLTFGPEHLSVAGTYVYTAVRGGDGVKWGSWHSIGYTIILEEAEDIRCSASVRRGRNPREWWFAKPDENRVVLRRQNSVGFDGFQATSFFFREPTCAASITR